MLSFVEFLKVKLIVVSRIVVSGDWRESRKDWLVGWLVS